MNVRLSANLSMLFTEAPYLKRFGLAARHGFRAVEESLFPYGEAPASAVAAELEGHGTMSFHQCRQSATNLRKWGIYERSV